MVCVVEEDETSPVLMDERPNRDERKYVDTGPFTRNQTFQRSIHWQRLEFCPLVSSMQVYSRDSGCKRWRLRSKPISNLCVEVHWMVHTKEETCVARG